MIIDEITIIESRLCRTRRIKLNAGFGFCYVGKVYKHNGKTMLRKTNVANVRKEKSYFLTREMADTELCNFGGLDTIIDELLYVG